MAVYLFDSSALVKRYVIETGSAWVTGILAPAAGHVIRLARVTGVEVVAAIARRQRGGSISPAAGTGMLSDFRQDFATFYQITEVSDRLTARAMDLAEVYPLRGYDAVQLAAALDVSADCAATGAAFTLVSADTELNDAARAEGLAVEDPNLHP